MPYPAGHKQRTRQRILRSAARLFADRGFDRTSIDDVMAACGLTRGAFYAHFGSKAQLHAEAMRGAGRPALPEDPRLAQGWADDLLAPLEASPSRASALSGRWAFLAADAASAAPEVRAGYAQAVRQLVASAARRGAGASGEAEDAALAAVAMLVGTLAVACTVDDDALRAAVVRACRRRVDAMEREAAADASADAELLWDVRPRAGRR